jgi:hypothetical protein
LQSVNRKTQDGAIGRSLEYINHAARVRVHSKTFTTLSIVQGAAIFEGTCSINGSPCTFSVTVTEGGKAGIDTFVIFDRGPRGGRTSRRQHSIY